MSVLVVGDLIYDYFLYGKAIGISAETPTVVAEELEETCVEGGAALVVRHMANLGHNNTLLTVGSISNTVEFHGGGKIVTVGIGWKTTKKKRFFVDGYKMVQFDVRNKSSHTKETEEKLITEIRAYINMNKVNTVVVSDNRHGTISSEIARWLVHNQEELGYKLLVDSQFSQEKPNHEWYTGCDTLFMNDKEVSYWLKEYRDIVVMGEYWGCNIVHKMGEKGAEAVIDGEYFKREAPKVNVVDTCGAGDAFLAAYVTSKSKQAENKLMDAIKYASETCSWKGTLIE